MQSYATSYYELAIGNQNSLNIKGVVVPNIMWMTRGESINSAFTEFAKNYAGFKSDVGITLIDAEAILRLAELKSTMTNNCYTCILLNLESIFQKGRISVGDVERIVNEAQNKISSKEDAITKSLQQSRAKFFP